MELNTKIDIQVEKTRKTRISEVDFNNIPFGRVFSDHMFVMEYSEGEWHDPHIQPYDKIQVTPAVSALHYGQSIFEGMKAFKDQNGNPLLFRPAKNLQRLNRSAERMAMPPVPEELFLQSLKSLVRLDKDWIPTRDGSALYIRPFMFATDEYIGIKPSDTFKFIIFTCPVGPYYEKPVKLLVADKHMRAFPGGVGFAKAAGNYGASLLPLKEGRDLGYDQRLWLDASGMKYIQESGTMNIFFIINGVVITPRLNDMILDGVTRNSVIQLFKDKNIKVEERDISVDEIAEAARQNILEDSFGTGTAATIAPVECIGYQGKDIYPWPLEKRKLSAEVKKELDSIRTSKTPDRHNWMVKIEE